MEDCEQSEESHTWFPGSTGGNDICQDIGNKRESIGASPTIISLCCFSDSAAIRAEKYRTKLNIWPAYNMYAGFLQSLKLFIVIL